MRGRRADEEHRTSTWLELLFDLCFVVAVAQAADRLHHALGEGHVGTALLGYAMVFFAIWWAWMNVTWFASAYDTDDVLYRLAVLVQIAGVLVLAAGVPRAFDRRDFTVVTIGYVIMRLSLVGQWLRAARADRDGRRTAVRYAIGVTGCTAGWVSLLALPSEVQPYGFLVLVPAELAVPPWAERRRSTSWHPHHIAERYGLFTLIVLGETVLAASTAIQSALDSSSGGGLVDPVAGGLLIVFGMWWIYFNQPTHRTPTRTGFESFLWGYGHLLVFASAAAVGAGLQADVDHHSELSAAGAGGAVAVPVALFLMSVWALKIRPVDYPVWYQVAFPLIALSVLVAGFAVHSVLAVGLLLAALAAFSAVLARAPRETDSGS